MSEANTIFDPVVRAALIERISALQPDNRALWGKMNVHQMVRHCFMVDGWVQGNNGMAPKQTLMGKIFGRRVLKRILKEGPLPKNMPSGKIFAVTDAVRDLEVQRPLWIQSLQEYASFDNPTFVHDFFGPMDREQIGRFVYKHTDHHLRQFGA